MLDQDWAELFLKFLKDKLDTRLDRALKHLNIFRFSGGQSGNWFINES